MFSSDTQRLALMRRMVFAGLVSMLAACSGGLPLGNTGTARDEGTGGAALSGREADLDDSPAVSIPPEAPFPWAHKTFPGKKLTRYVAVRTDGRDAIRSHSDSAASMLRQKLRVESADLGQIAFSWKVAGTIKGADLTQRDSDDSPVRVVLLFDGDRANFSGKNAMLSELAHALTGEPLPYATLMYVWGNRMPAGSIVVNPRTDRIRKLVLESGSGKVGRWLDYERDIRADYEKVFGETPGALVGVGIMTDTDNTRQQVQAWYGPVILKGKTPGPSSMQTVRP